MRTKRHPGFTAIALLLLVLLTACAEDSTDGTPADIPDASTIAPTTTTPPATTLPPTTTTTIPPLPEDVPGVRLTSISLAMDTFVVRYEVNFEPNLSDEDPDGVHLHFFWNRFAPETAGEQEPATSRAAFIEWDTGPGGTLQFDYWDLEDVPGDTTGICAVPATSAHEIPNIDRIDEIHSCIALPEG